MQTFNILLLEDDQQQIEFYEQTLSADSGRLKNHYKLLTATNVEKAKSIVNSNIINAAILDLEVPYSSNERSSTKKGTEYLKEILSEKHFPIVIVSANISYIDVQNDDNLPFHLEVMLKESGVYSDAFMHFEKIEKLLCITPSFPNAIKEIKSAFWNLWGNWQDIESRLNNVDLSNVDLMRNFLKRYVSNYIIEKSINDYLYNNMLHTEFYTYEFIRDRIHTGDIIKLDNKYWIVITAPCDLSNGECKYPDNLTLLHCIKQELEDNSYKKIVKPFRDPKSTKEAKEKSMKKVAKIFTSQEISSHYLPPWEKDGLPFKVEFKQIQAIPFKSKSDQKKALDNRVASLSSHFIPNLLQRYGMYVSRIGQADIDTENYIKYLLSVVPK